MVQPLIVAQYPPRKGLVIEVNRERREKRDLGVRLGTAVLKPAHPLSKCKSQKKAGVTNKIQIPEFNDTADKKEKVAKDFRRWARVITFY